LAEIEQVRLDMNGFAVNAYVVHAPEGDVVVDAGAEPGKILAALKQPVAAILMTHKHADHVDALDEVRRGTGNPPVYMHPIDAEDVGVTGYEPLEDGQELSLAGETFLVLHTPGHSRGHVSFVVGEDQIVGDLIMPGSVGRTDRPGESWEEIEVSVRKVMPLWKDQTRLFCGHGAVLVAMEELKTNPYLPLGLIE